MNKIPFEDGTKTQEAYVTVNGQNYPVTPAVWSGTTPLKAQNLNQLQSNIEEAINEMQNNIEDTIDKKTVAKRYLHPGFYAEPGDKVSTGFRYEVGNDSLEVYYCGTKLIKDVDYEEDGTAGQTTTWIKMLDTIGDLDMSDVEGFEDFEETLEFIVRGDYSAS